MGPDSISAPFEIETEWLTPYIATENNSISERSIVVPRLMLDVFKILVALSSALQFSLIIFLWIYKQYLINRNNRALRALSRARRESLERYLDELEDESPRTISYVFTVV